MIEPKSTRSTVRATLVATLLFCLLFSTSGCIIKDSPIGAFYFGRISELSYILNIGPNQNQKLKNFTLYLPFPHRDGELVPELLKALRDDQRSLVKFEGQDKVLKMDMDEVDTRFGKMLRIRVPEMWRGGGLVVITSILDFYRRAAPPLNIPWDLKLRRTGKAKHTST